MFASPPPQCRSPWADPWPCLVALLETAPPSAECYMAIAQPRVESFQADLLPGILPTIPEDAEFSLKQLSCLHSKVSVLQRLLLLIAMEKGGKISVVSTEY